MSAGSECGKELYSSIKPPGVFPEKIWAEIESMGAEVECQFANSAEHFRHASGVRYPRRIHNGKTAPMSQFEDPSAQTSVDPYSDAYTQPVASSRDQEPNPRRSRSHSRERPASYNRASTPPKRPAHAPIVSHGGGSILDHLSTCPLGP